MKKYEADYPFNHPTNLDAEMLVEYLRLSSSYVYGLDENDDKSDWDEAERQWQKVLIVLRRELVARLKNVMLDTLKNYGKHMLDKFGAYCNMHFKNLSSEDDVCAFCTDCRLNSKYRNLWDDLYCDVDPAEPGINIDRKIHITLGGLGLPIEKESTYHVPLAFLEKGFCIKDRINQ